jgi:hypothetical protein
MPVLSHCTNTMFFMLAWSGLDDYSMRWFIDLEHILLQVILKSAFIL